MLTNPSTQKTQRLFLMFSKEIKIPSLVVLTKIQIDVDTRNIDTSSSKVQILCFVDTNIQDPIKEMTDILKMYFFAF